MRAVRFHSFVLATVIAILVISGQASAQFTDSMGTGFNNPISAQISTMTWNRIFYRTTVRTPSRPSTTSSKAPSTVSSTSPAPTTQMDQSALRFRSSGTRLATPKLAEQLANTPADREQYLKLMNAVLDGFDQKAKQAGLQNDIAIAMSYFLAENARIYHGLPELSDQQYIQIRSVIAEAFLGTGTLNSITDRQKQEFYEGLVAYTGITQFGYEQSKQAGNEQIAQLYQKVAGQNLQTVTRMSPDNINVTSDGLTATTAGDANVMGSSAGNNETSLPASGNPIDIGQLRRDYSENEVRADHIYKGKRFIFTGTVVEVSGVYYKTTGQDPSGRYIYTNVGPNLKVTNTGGGTIIGWDVHCFFKDSNQLAQLSGQQKVTFEATVDGRENGGTNIILVDGVLR